MLSVARDQKADMPTHSMITQRMLGRIEENIKKLFPENTELLEQFDAGHYARCTEILQVIVTNFKVHRQLNSKTRAERERVYQDLKGWYTKYARHLRPQTQASGK